MTGPSCLAGAFAALMIVIAIYCARRLVTGHLRRKGSEADVDALHMLMTVAMAGMFEPRLSVMPETAWLAVFTTAAAWFGWRAIPARARRTRGHVLSAHQLPHVVESAAMIYMFQAAASRPEGHAAGVTMPGSNPIVALALALFMLGYIIWTADRLAGMRRTTGIRRPQHTPADSGTQALAPRLAASYKIVTSIAMGYMLVSML